MSRNYSTACYLKKKLPDQRGYAINAGRNKNSFSGFIQTFVDVIGKNGGVGNQRYTYKGSEQRALNKNNMNKFTESNNASELDEIV